MSALKACYMHLQYFYSAVQINVVKGCVSAVFIYANLDHVYLGNRVYELWNVYFCASDCIWSLVILCPMLFMSNKLMGNLPCPIE